MIKHVYMCTIFTWDCHMDYVMQASFKKKKPKATWKFDIIFVLYFQIP